MNIFKSMFVKKLKTTHLTEFSLPVEALHLEKSTIS